MYPETITEHGEALRLLDAHDELNDEQRAQRKRLQTEVVRLAAEDPNKCEVADPDSNSTTQTTATQSLGLRAIERHESKLSPKANDTLDEVVRSNDPLGIGARYLDAVADENYHAAFGKMLQYGETAALRM